VSARFPSAVPVRWLERTRPICAPGQLPAPPAGAMRACPGRGKATFVRGAFTGTLQGSNAVARFPVWAEEAYAVGNDPEPYSTDNERLQLSRRQVRGTRASEQRGIDQWNRARAGVQLSHKALARADV
jgi:hypothetical protein